jgi:hydrogenase-4 component B
VPRCRFRPGPAGRRLGSDQAQAAGLADRLVLAIAGAASGWLWLAMPALVSVALGASGRRFWRVRRVPAWRSATAGVEGPDSYTAFGFANPARRVLAGVLHTRAQTRRVPPAAMPRAARAGSGRARLAGDDQWVPAGPEPCSPAGSRPASPPGPAHVGYYSDVIEVVEEYLYRPALRPVQALTRQAKRLQSGRLDAYLAYLLIALIALLAVVAAVS